MSMRARWEITEDERHAITLDLQDSEREIRRLTELTEVWATLTIQHDEWGPEAISELLGLEPDDVVRKDETITPEGRFDVRSTFTIWRLSSEQKIKVRYFAAEEHLQWLIDQITGRLPQLRSLQDSGARTEIDIHSYSWSRLESIELSTEMLLLLARYRLKIRINVFYENSDEDY